ncbi:ADP-forming succinate--CoA ligase subunit beta [Actinomyces sp. MRS3W]|uniref:ADP-forming succinate--CoA ligase subunit beta n=1 Tax=Actinomyces sp. MRS3W TaxID=2800796 RepID=UPI0028FD75D4|nr:ADP-forming succinate--CoA ligase subunit beta [Actinomyces sp. MRS3W]MDU0349597.1 ADP-forming succinate--CoA ligase subunit beta [Actinomyces sp. MRS3W]
MDLYEYQARELFAAHRVPIPQAGLATAPQQARTIADELLATGAGRVMVKAQVKSGGRGRAGGVRAAATAQEAAALAAQMLGRELCGHTVNSVLVTAAVDVAQELYVAMALDRSEKRYLAICSRLGGTDIDTLARTHPGVIARAAIDPLEGLTAPVAARVTSAAGLDDALAAPVIAIILRLWEVLVGEDATLVEVNPLVITPARQVLALDAKVTLDDNAAFRHPAHAALADHSADHALEMRARSLGLRYVPLEGEVGILGNGAGLVLSTLDVVTDAGRRHGGVRPANFLDLGGGAAAVTMAAGLELVASDPQVRVILINIFGGITACDTIAAGIIQASAALKDGRPPLVVRLDGNNAARGRQMLATADLPGVTVLGSMAAAADVATALAQARREPAATSPGRSEP